jgi:hypothetical protein
MKKILLSIFFFNLFVIQISATEIKPIFTTEEYVSTLKKITDVMVNDVASPVVASRYYAYISLSAYEVQSAFNPLAYPSMAGKVNGLKKIIFKTKEIGKSDAQLAIQLALLKSAIKLLPSGYMLNKEVDSIATKYNTSATQKSLYQNTAIVVDSLVIQVIRYARQDGFPKINNLPKYILKNGDGYWKPTPPAFMAPVEPHWNTIRPFFLDSAQQFKTKPPVPYDTSINSSFYGLMKEVFEIRNTLTEEQKNIASFWDCNPFAVQQIGHVEFGLKKISPGGHWIGITGIACKKSQLTLEKTVYIHLAVSATIFDAFIACWDEKYRSNRIRPETVIQKLLQKNWHPLLQTPPFPEYVSGHSVVSSAAAEVLSKYFGDNFSYEDDTEVEFDLPIRHFTSFRQAAEEASVSRLYGGIHYRDAITEGIWLGKKVGQMGSYKL